MTQVGDVLNIPAIGGDPDPADGVIVYADSAVQTILPSGEIALVEQPFPHHDSRFADEMDFAVGAGNTVAYGKGEGYENYAFQSPSGTVGDTLSWSALLAAGTYTCKIQASKSVDRGILALKANGVTVSTYDWYASPAVANVVWVTTGITLPAGQNDFVIEVTGKNASSSGYFFVLTVAFLTRTGA